MLLHREFDINLLKGIGTRRRRDFVGRKYGGPRCLRSTDKLPGESSRTQKAEPREVEFIKFAVLVCARRTTATHHDWRGG